MRKVQALLAACCAATLLLGFAPNGPSASAVRAKANIGDLKSLYFGYWSSNNGDNEGGAASLNVGAVKGTQFTGEVEMVTTLARGVEGEGFVFADVSGSVTTKGKLKMGASLGEGVKFNYTGQLSDQGILIQGTYTAKQGKKVLKKGVITFIAQS